MYILRGSPLVLYGPRKSTQPVDCMALNCAKPVHWNLMSQRICRGGRPRVREKPDPQRIAPECLYQSKFDSRPSRKSGSSFAFCREHHPGCEARLPEPQRNRSGMPLKGLMRTLSPCRDVREWSENPISLRDVRESRNHISFAELSGN